MKAWMCGYRVLASLFVNTGLRNALEILTEKGVEEVKRLITTKTFDEKQMEKLKLQFANMAPSLAKIRGGALDCGLY